MKPTIAKTLGVMGIALITLPLIAQAENFGKSSRSAEQSYDFRASTMGIYKWYLGPMGAMVKGKMDFDAKKFAAYAAGLETASKLDLLEGFPVDSGLLDVDDSSAKAEIWENTDDFTKKFKALQTEAAKLAEVAKSGDEAAMKAQFKKTGGTCGGCHKKYKAD